jgi:hypothetical protein
MMMIMVMSLTVKYGTSKRGATLLSVITF